MQHTTKKIISFLLLCSSSFMTMNSIANNINKETSPTNGQWVHSEDLESGMQVITADGQTLTVKQRWRQRHDSVTTYNFEVANHHTYFISEAKIWNHNMTDCKKPGVWQRIKNRVWGTPPPPYDVQETLVLDTIAALRGKQSDKIAIVINSLETKESGLIQLMIRSNNVTPKLTKEIQTIHNQLERMAKHNPTYSDIAISYETKNPEILDTILRELGEHEMIRSKSTQAYKFFNFSMPTGYR